uniref:hypothetical protein n=1 Tax=Alistipes sp. TaxID=1872444 RepID=UPI004057B87B
MRKFFKLMMSVVAMAAVVSCTTDVTEDLGVKVGGKTQLTLSLDNTRTQLGYKNGTDENATYALTWAVDDQISVNGEISDKLTAANGAGTANATFTFDGELETPYFIAYPAAEKNNQVVFPAEQNYNEENPIENGVTVMYGYSENGKNISINHLTGLLKIGVKGTATLASACISTVDRKPIAGTFNAKYDVEKETLELTSAETVNVINYSFGGGLELNSEKAQYFYVSVPAGTYDELYVLLEDVDGGIMRATVAATSKKPIDAGDVREFSSDLVYAATDTNEVFVISDQQSLYDFRVALESAEATLASDTASEEEKAAATATLQKNAIMVADVDVKPLPEIAHKAITAPNYTGEFNGNGYAIIFNSLYVEDSKTTEPLFNETAATIKGVHLKGVNILSAATSDLGALVNTYTGTSVTHCSAEGKIELDAAAVARVSGLVAYIPHSSTQPFTMTDCVNNCAIDITLNTQNALVFGGCLGQVGSNSSGTTPNQKGLTFTNNVNNATISIDGTSTSDVFGAGILGRVGFYKTNIDNCENNGMVSAHMTKACQIRIAGVTGLVYNSSADTDPIARTNFSNCSNTATISVKNTSETVDGTLTFASGCFAQMENVNKNCGCEITNCNNSGNILLDTTGIDNYNKMTYVGGVIAYSNSSIAVTNCNNTAEKVEVKMTGASESVSVGGVLAMCRVRQKNANTTTTLKNCTNKSDVTATIAKSGLQVYVGGVAGWIYGYSSTTFKYVFEDVHNYGSVKATVNDKIGSKNVTLYLGGILGSDKQHNVTGTPDGSTEGNTGGKDCQFTRCYTHAAEDGSKSLYVMANNVYEVYAGGLIGAAVLNFTMNTCENNLPFLYEGTNVTNRNFYGGLVGKIIPKLNNKTTTIDGFTNNGNITVKPVSEIEYSISGGIAYCDNSGNVSSALNLKNMTNKGNITVTTGKSDGSNYAINHTRIAGLYAMTNRGDTKTCTHTFENLKNFGDISVSKVAATNTDSTKGTITVGGVIGLCYKKTAIASNLYSNCDITVTDCTSGGATRVGALLGGFQSDDIAMGTGNSVGGSVNGVTLTADNYYQYVFSGGTAETCGGVTLLAPIVDTPAEE